MTRVTASKAGLLFACGWWARPEAEWNDSVGAHAERGNRFHAAIADYIHIGRIVDVADDIKAEIAHAISYVRHLGDPQDMLPEPAYAWSPKTDEAELLHVMGGRDYSKGAGLLCGSADIVILRGDDTGYVADWKTGDGSKAGPQLRALALMAARAHRLDEVTIECLEVRADGVHVPIRETLTSFDLDGIAGELADLIERIPSSEPKPGPHCSELYCPAKLSCPAGQEATAQLLPVEALTAQRYSLRDPITTPEQAVWALDVLRLVTARADAMKDQIKQMVPAEGWRLEDGRVLREGSCQQSAFDKGKALALCKQLGATPEQLASLTYKFEKSTGLRVSKGGRR